MNNTMNNTVSSSSSLDDYQKGYGAGKQAWIDGSSYDLSESIEALEQMSMIDPQQYIDGWKAGWSDSEDAYVEEP